MKDMKISAFLKSIIFSLFAGAALHAADINWLDSGTDFNTGANWDGGNVPGSSDRAIYGDTGNRSSILSDPVTIQGISFNGTGASGYTISGDPITLSSTSATKVSSAINVANNHGGTNTISSDIILSGAAGQTAYFYGGNAVNTLVFSGDISSSNAIAGINLDTGFFRLLGDNSYSGYTQANAVTLQLGSATALSSGDLIASGGGSFDNVSGSDLTLNNNNIILNANYIFLGTNSVDLGTGKIIVNGGTRNLKMSASAAPLTIDSLDADALMGGLSQEKGTLIIKNAAGTNFQGGYRIFSNAKTIIGHKDALGTGLLTFDSGSLSASSDLSGANAVANAILITGPQGKNITGDQNITLSGDMTVASGAARGLSVDNTGDTLLSGSIYLSDTAGVGGDFTLKTTTALTVSGAITDYNGEGTAGNLTLNGGDVIGAKIMLTSANSSYTGKTLVGGRAVVEVTKLANGGSNSSIGASSNAAENLVITARTAFRYVGSGDSTDRLFTLYIPFNTNSAVLDSSGTGAVHFTNTGSLVLSGTVNSQIFNLTGSNEGDNSLAAAIPDVSNGLTVRKTGVGKWILSGTNTNANIRNDEGTLQFAKKVSILNGDFSSITATNFVTSSGATTVFNAGGTGEFTSSDITTLTSKANNSNNGFSNGSYLGLDTTNASGGKFTHNDMIANPRSGSNILGLKKFGDGILELTNDNTYTGETIVLGGTLLIQGAQTGSGLVTVQSGAVIGGHGSVAGSLSILSGAKIAFSLTDTLTVNGTNVTFGGLSIADILGLDGSVATGEYTLIDGTATFDFSNVSNWGIGNAVGIGGGKSAYFDAGSLKVIVIPEPTSILLMIVGLAGVVFLGRRRRA